MKTPEPAGVELAGVSRRFDQTLALDDVSLSISGGELFSLLGPSGCGKTTLLRIIGGFETPDRGTIRIAGRDVTAVSPQGRPTAMVFQSYALFPHMTVGANVEYGLRVQRLTRTEIAQRVSESLDMVGMRALSDRPVTALSGGQQQRVALARAMAVQPRVLLFDEPLSNLDLALRERTRSEIRRIQQELGVTAVYVTHDQTEALAMSDRIGVMRDGRLEQIGRPEDLYDAPATAYVASFLGSANIVENSNLAERLAGTPAVSGKVLAVRPQSLTLTEDGLECTVVSTQYLGPVREVSVRLPDESEIRVHVDPGEPIAATIRIRATSFVWVRPG
ncbi:MAG: ABC transporter ATP-binding protein [Bacteroidetes bacterium]|nr:ABC transporter ATP-binding protein [Bacteroidota bacterium]